MPLLAVAIKKKPPTSYVDGFRKQRGGQDSF
jgi:hypothetical protein